MRQELPADEKPGLIWKRPSLPPLPLSTAGVHSPVLSLNSLWKFTPSPQAEFWAESCDESGWLEIAVPGYLPTQGIRVEPGNEYAYRHRFRVPADYRGKRLFLRFDGVNCQARVWVNGQYVRSHYGGFTSWYCEVTGLLSPGKSALLAVGVTDQPREISSFHGGGILRDVRLVAFPKDYLARLHVETDLDPAYRDADLKVTAAVDFGEGAEGRIQLTLVDPNGQKIALPVDSLTLRSDEPEKTLLIPVAMPHLWDAEHPNLYSLEAALEVNGVVVETVRRQVGFRKIEVRGNQLLVNGREVKLRGVNRHDTCPTTGRTVTPAMVEHDVRLFRDANINFIRTSHYPPREDFLDLCDRYGIYVEDEISVAFVYQFIEPTMNDPRFTEAYLGQFAEMIERDRSHACVLMWSLANESYWGSNFEAEYDYAKREDATRPVIFSYPITIPDGPRKVDIWSLHYGSWDYPSNRLTDNFNVGEAWGELPVLHDEFAHIPCYDFSEQMRDPGVREFWGESIKRFWENIFTMPGALGGAIWAGIDDVLIVPGNLARFEWGIIDGWRREKPEYWMTKKAYSPVRVEEVPVAVPVKGASLSVPVRNWFDHTNLQEIAVEWRVGEESGLVQGPDVAPHAVGELEIPAREWVNGEKINLKFIRREGFLVDEYNLTVGTTDQPRAVPGQSAPMIIETEETITLKGTDFHVVFARKDGLIKQAVRGDTVVLCGGPILQLEGIPLADWTLEKLSAEAGVDAAAVRISGSYGSVQVTFEVGIDGNGGLTTRYILDRLPYASPRARKLGVGVDVGGYREVGVAFILPSEVDRLNWERTGLWSAYPAYHIGRSSGTAFRERGSGSEYCGAVPDWSWSQDERNFSLFGRYDFGGRGTNDFRSMKQNLTAAEVLLRGTDSGVQVLSGGRDSVRLEILPYPGSMIDDRDGRVKYSGDWVQVDGQARNYAGTETISRCSGAAVEFTFQGTGVAWIGGRDLILGIANVYIDDILAAKGIDQFNPWVIGTARGEEKEYRQILFSKEGLPEGQHTVRIVVTGEKNARASSAYVSIDAFVLLGQGRGDVRMNVINEWNYPELTWGNYVNPPVMVEEGYHNEVRVRLK